MNWGYNSWIEETLLHFFITLDFQYMKFTWILYIFLPLKKFAILCLHFKSNHEILIDKEITLEVQMKRGAIDVLDWDDDEGEYMLNIKLL